LDKATIEPSYCEVSHQKLGDTDDYITLTNVPNGRFSKIRSQLIKTRALSNFAHTDRVKELGIILAF